ncbi:uncharacterized protein LOC106156467 [Lingula anatina]|uniref:Uncharacterized protein LOC106156467 n=1 Tax=Lingula anatina TaxID=7574 RepID=A0A1S3HNS3_LINAN|nr:uncharacterized protein LOC106156467 [Lingula anatina]|eukprot:XP_013387181.1 uncharacterized protein LOC106156467 [Lingula anatina]
MSSRLLQAVKVCRPCLTRHLLQQTQRRHMSGLEKVTRIIKRSLGNESVYYRDGDCYDKEYVEIPYNVKFGVLTFLSCLFFYFYYHPMIEKVDRPHYHGPNLHEFTDEELGIPPDDE